jgi:hypothetical protein
MARAEALRPILADLAELPALAVAAELNRRKVATPASGKWHAQTIIRVRERLARARLDRQRAYADRPIVRA